MAEWLKIGTRSELPAENQAREFPCGGKMVCVANLRGELSAMENYCLHRGGPLGQGTIEGDKLVCPWHGWQFDPRTGEAVQNPSFKVKTFPLKIEGEDVMVEV